MMVDTLLSRAEYVEAVWSSLQQQGWDPWACCSVDEADAVLRWWVTGRSPRLSNAAWTSWWW